MTDGKERPRGAFGPLEALDEMQRQALEAATRIMSELTALDTGLAQAAWLDGRPSVDGVPLVDVGRLRGESMRTADTLAELMRALLDVGFDALDELARRRVARSVDAARAGGTTTVTCTVANESEQLAHDLRPHLSPLWSSAGRELSAHAAARPEQLDLPPRSQATVTLEVAVAPDAAPGLYHGVLLLGGLPDVAHLVTIEVLADVHG